MAASPSSFRVPLSLQNAALRPQALKLYSRTFSVVHVFVFRKGRSLVMFVPIPSEERFELMGFVGDGLKTVMTTSWKGKGIVKY